jgi:hypothetical protein
VTPKAEAEAVTADASHRFAAEVTIEVVRRAWPRILTIIRQTSPKGIAFLEKAEPVDLEGHTIVLEFSNAYARDRINDKGRSFVEKAINQGLNTDNYKIRCTLADPNAPTGVKNSGASSVMVAESDTADSSLEMGTLLEAPPVQSTGPKRIADFDMPSAPPTTTYQSNGKNGADHVAETPDEESILSDVLGIFGGEVISTEESDDDG